jgi:hypothetical protein
MKKDLVLSFILGYPYNKLEPFVKTLRKTGFDGDVVVFFNNLTQDTIEKLRPFDIKLIKFDAEEFRRENIPLFHYRFYLFRDFISKNRDKYRMIFLTDMRDVVFQKNPFEYSGYSKINFFLEDLAFKDSNINFFTIKKIGGDGFANKHLNDLVSCAGTTLGESKTILEYCQKMSDNLKSGLPLDQGFHNFLIYSNKFKKYKIFRNFHGPVLTVSNLGKKEFKYNANNDLVNLDNSIINTIHQYDRCYALSWKFNRPQIFILRFLESEFIKFKRFVKKILFHIPLLNTHFKKRYYDPTQFN